MYIEDLTSNNTMVSVDHLNEMPTAGRFLIEDIYVVNDI